jgi:hypothetical protein
MINRRKFLETATAASIGFTIVPRNVLGGPGYVSPSDQLAIANIGCGTQGLREMVDLLPNPKVRVVAVADPVKSSNSYIDWSPFGIRNAIRKAINKPEWGEKIKGIPGGRDIMTELVNGYYSVAGQTNYKGVKAYSDYRELLDKESGIDVVKIMTPDHLHASIALAAMKKGIRVVTHKPIGNRMHEARVAIETSRRTGIGTHLLAWSVRKGNETVKKWISEGAIGTLKEIHNWSYRPVWQQWDRLPADRPPVPEGFDWDLWLGPVPDRPYHPNYTHCVFRGWYDFGGGSIADMGHYSLWPMFMTLGINTAPYSAEAYSTTSREVVDHVSKPVVNDVAFPLSCIIRFKFPKQDSLPPFDLFWYDGGMKPHNPDELEMDGKDLPAEGMMFVGDKGKILGGFRNESPVLIPERRMQEMGYKSESDPETSSDIWIDSFLEGKPSPGSFTNAGPVTETINLGAVALRAKRKVLYDSASMQITNLLSANVFLTRKFRQGWEI